LTLGSDTNGSVRVPAALCGVFSLKPTYGRISCRGMLPFCDTLDAVGAFAGSVRDLAVSYDVLHGHDPADPISVDHPRDPAVGLDAGIEGLRLAVADGYFARGGDPQTLDTVAALADALGLSQRISIPHAAAARAAAMVITATEGAQLHLESLRRRPGDFDPMTRDRFLAGALAPARAYLQAQELRVAFRARMAALFESVDVILAPATPFPAPVIGQREAVVDGVTVRTQPYLGVYTQPISFAGLPVLTIPVGSVDGLPVGVQLIGAHYAEGTLLRLAAELEARGLARPAVGVAPWR
jgi:Asp-tRNA(Asn)/Glu-tRNA(Gln) amidotransferase A subunit family amidase